MDTKAENLRPWARRCPRLALVSVHLMVPIIWLLCVLEACIEGFQGFREAWCDSFSDEWPTMKCWIAETRKILRQEIAGR